MKVNHVVEKINVKFNFFCQWSESDILVCQKENTSLLVCCHNEIFFL